MKAIPLYLLVIAIGYLLGSIPTGQVVAWLAGGGDLSRQGSGKTGTTNVLRTLGWKAAVIVVIGDLAKGVAAFLIARAIAHPAMVQHIAEVLAGFAAVIGHNWPIYNKLKGGRGVVTSQAILLLICWPVALIATAIFVAVLAVSRFVSLASLTGTAVALILLAIWVYWQHLPVPYLAYGVLAAGLIWLRHIDNIQRLLAGTERKLGQKAQPLP